MQEVLARAAREPHIRAIVVTCGRAEIWEKVLARHNLSHVRVLGSSRLADNSYVITDILKSRIVRSLQAMRLRVIAFGDSPLDLPMLRSADKAYIVVGSAATRSTTMDNALSHALSSGLEVHQILLPPFSPPRIDPITLPIISLTPSTVTTLFRRPFIHATPKPAALLLATPTRDAALSGPALRKAHERIGTYLAMEYLSSIVGLATHDIAHVQGHSVAGHHFHSEDETLILPLMRGGEPMALSTSKAFPRASFAHTRTYPDIEQANFIDKKTVVIVDSVVNTGASVVGFMRALRRDHPHVRVIVVAGVVQAGAVMVGALADMLESDENLTLVALRKSENRYKGVDGTDTGHRLFGTTYLA